MNVDGTQALLEFLLLPRATIWWMKRCRTGIQNENKMIDVMERRNSKVFPWNFEALLFGIDSGSRDRAVIQTVHRQIGAHTRDE